MRGAVTPRSRTIERTTSSMTDRTRSVDRSATTSDSGAPSPDAAYRLYIDGGWVKPATDARIDVIGANTGLSIGSVTLMKRFHGPAPNTSAAS